MAANPIKSVSMEKYERLLPRLFPGSSLFEIRDMQGGLIWQLPLAATKVTADPTSEPDPAELSWSSFGPGIERCHSGDGDSRFRAALGSQATGPVARLIVAYDTKISSPLSTATDTIEKAFTDVQLFLQEEMDLQAESDELAAELTERYEELNLVYATNDQVIHVEEGQAALQQLVVNCTDYLDVSFAVLICRQRNLSLHSARNDCSADDVEALTYLLDGPVYERMEAQQSYLVINEADDIERKLLFNRPGDILLVQPIFDDHSTVIGILAVIAKRGRRIFSNGDKNLLAVMAKKASKVIHTHHDSLTGLMNRGGFEAALMSALVAVKSKARRSCFLHIDINQLHVVNDLMGHHEGDVLLRRVARTLQSCLRESDDIGRLAGDEFAVVISDCTIPQARTIAEKIRDAISLLKVVSTDRQLEVSVSIGVVNIKPQSEGIAGLMATGEIACKSAKEAGRNEIRVYADDNTSLVRRSAEVEWIGRIQNALRDDEFALYCQPVVPLANPTAAPHFEILIRLMEGDRVLSPAEFLPAAERYQLMPQIDRWVIRKTLQALALTWTTIADRRPVFCLNLSGQSLTNTGFQAFVLDELERSPVPSENICFEITETCAIANIDDATEFMAGIQRTGSKFSLDDFGAGLSSFGYLKVLPVDYLKIDGSFIKDMVSDSVSKAMVEAICQIADTMGLSTVAEFVGDEETVQLLRGIGVNYVQGYYVGKPAPLAEITDSLCALYRAASA